MYLRWEIPSLRAPLLGKRTQSFPNDKHCTEEFGFTNSDFSKSFWNLVWSCNNPFSFGYYLHTNFKAKLQQKNTVVDYITF